MSSSSLVSPVAVPLPPRTLGILGGGQLGRMLCLAARPLGIRTIIVDPTPGCPAASSADEHIVGSFTDVSVIARLAALVDVVTVEIEHINTDALLTLRVPVHPSPALLAVVADKLEQKRVLAAAGVPVGAFQSVDSRAELAAVAQKLGYPVLLKSRRLAYDGRGNAVVADEAGIEAAWAALAPGEGSGEGLLYVEAWVPFVRELAVIIAVGSGGAVSVYPVVQTVQRNNICHVVVAPAPIGATTRTRAVGVARAALSALSGLPGGAPSPRGVFAVELFELPDGSVLLNEVAPRVHNSGHFTVEACVTSQFEQHVRAVMGMPLGLSSLKVGASIMLNVLGAVASGTGGRDVAMAATWALCARALATPGASLHWYDKAECKTGRKMGHITVTGDSPMEAAARAGAISGGSPLPPPAPLVGIIMGSDSDLPCMSAAASMLAEFGVPCEVTIVSAHRTPKRMVEYAGSARSRGLSVIIAGAGGAAHLPGMVAAMTSLPVIGVPVPGKYLDGQDSLYSIVQMPKGVPVATVAIGNAANAALLAVRILSTRMPHLGDAMEAWMAVQEGEVLGKAAVLESGGWAAYGKK